MRRRLESLGAGALALGAGVIVIASYSLYAALPYLLGPSLTATASAEGADTVIAGKTERVAYLSIDGAAVPLQEDGSFSEERSFPSGYTAVEISAKDRFGRSLTKTLTFITK